MLYAVGGYDGVSRSCLVSVERYSPQDNTWTFVKDMSTRRSGAGNSNRFLFLNFFRLVI